jgi:Fe-S-cluster containining protein
MPVEIQAEDLVRLGWADEFEIEEDPARVARKLIKSGLIRSYRASTRLFQIAPRTDGACGMLGPDNRCTVYEKRPGVCRKFPLEMGNRLGFCPAKSAE